LLPQTRRHLLIARLLGLRQAIVFVNKMDAAGYERAAFVRVREAVEAFASRLQFDRFEVIPGSALAGDMVVERGESLGWYEGPTLLETLEGLNAAAESAAAGPLRFPIQLVSRPQGATPRAYMGRLESGHLLVGTEVLALPSGRRTRVRQILLHDAERELAVAGDSVSVVLSDDIDLSRGDWLADPVNPPRETRSVDLTLIWLGSEPLRGGGRYVLQQASRRAPAKVAEVSSRLDVHTLEATPAEGEVVLNDIVRARLTLQAPFFVDSYEAVRTTGAVILIDEATNHTVAAGLVR
jgi:sulfate adenylyltransferase subunit 1